MVTKYVYNNESESYIDNLINSLEAGILLVRLMYDEEDESLNFTISWANKAFEEMFSLDSEIIIGKTVEEAFENNRLDLAYIYRQAAKSGVSMKSNIHFESRGRHYKVNIMSPARGHIITFFYDITDEIKADEILKKYFLLFENAHDILLYLKSDGGIIDANKTAVKKYGYSYEELLDMNIQQLRHPSMALKYNKQMEVSESEGIIFEGVHMRKDGTSFPVEVSSRSIYVKGELLRVHIIRDITERRDAEDKIKYLANHDTLTGIANRRFLMEQLEDILELSRRDNLKFAVMLFDIDKFKSINDKHGHNTGDEVLRTVASRLQGAVGKSDIVGRLGGDEFLVIQTAIEHREDSLLLADRINNTLCRPVRLGGFHLDLSISLGVSVYPETAEGLIHYADLAMYSVKQRGGNSFDIYSADTSYNPSNDF